MGRSQDRNESRTVGVKKEADVAVDMDLVQRDVLAGRRLDVVDSGLELQSDLGGGETKELLEEGMDK